MKSRTSRPIADVAADLGLSADNLEFYGVGKAKIPLDVFPSRQSPGRLVVATAIAPTPDRLAVNAADISADLLAGLQGCDVRLLDVTDAAAARQHPSDEGGDWSRLTAKDPVDCKVLVRPLDAGVRGPSRSLPAAAATLPRTLRLPVPAPARKRQ